VLVIAMIPISELRGAIPVALGAYNMNPAEAYFFSVTGNIIPVVPLLLFLGRVERWLRRFSFFRWFFDGLFSRTRRRTEAKVQKYGALGLVPFVAIPLPVTGAWTGVAAAYIFGIKFKYAFPAITVGVLIAGVVVTLASIGAITLW
jgi:uncharacterized membrane protein